jgi:lipopolysaccharide export system protein LptA
VVLLALVGLLTALPTALPADEIQFSGQSTSIELTEGRERTVLSGNARIVSESTRIEAGEIELYGEDFRYAEASGSVVAVDEEDDIRLESGTIFYDREAEILRAQQDVTMEDDENDLVVRAGFIEYRKADGIAIIQLGVRVFGEDFTARAEFARYRRSEDVVELSGLPVVFWEDDEYRATRIIVNMDTDEITLEGEVRGQVTTEEQDGAGESGSGENAAEEGDASEGREGSGGGAGSDRAGTGGGTGQDQSEAGGNGGSAE